MLTALSQTHQGAITQAMEGGSTRACPFSIATICAVIPARRKGAELTRAADARFEWSKPRAA
jgi:hypothetical protein